MRMNWKGGFLLMALSIGCSEDPAPVTQDQELTITFDSPAKLPIKENDGSDIVIPIKLSLSHDEPIVITYETIGQEVVNGSDYTIISTNPVTIPAGSTQASVTLRINDNDVVQPEERGIYLRFRTIDKSVVKIGTPKEVVISILEDDCLASISNVALWFGDLNLQNQNEVSTGTGLENSSGVCSGSFDVKGKFVGNENPESTVTIKLVQNPLAPTKGTATIDRSKLFTFTSQFEVEATGIYDETTKKITLNYSFFDLTNSSNNFKDTMVIESK